MHIKSLDNRFQKVYQAIVGLFAAVKYIMSLCQCLELQLDLTKCPLLCMGT